MLRALCSFEACERNMRHEFFGDGAPILTEMYIDRYRRERKDRRKRCFGRFGQRNVLPVPKTHKGKNKWYWEEGFKGIKYANIAISRVSMLEPTRMKQRGMLCWVLPIFRELTATIS